MNTSKVLIPVDGSEVSLQILPHVTRFLKPQETEIVLLYVAEPPQMVQMGDSNNPDLVIYADQEAASIEAGFVSAMGMHVGYLNHAGFNAIPAVRFGDPATEIERYIADEKVDLVAMTTHGRTGLARVLMGSVAQHIVNHTNVPVLLFRSM
jgi:nucleotide-binding universal stress UspA family protein